MELHKLAAQMDDRSPAWHKALLDLQEERQLKRCPVFRSLREDPEIGVMTTVLSADALAVKELDVAISVNALWGMDLPGPGLCTVEKTGLDLEVVGGPSCEGVWAVDALRLGGHPLPFVVREDQVLICRHALLSELDQVRFWTYLELHFHNHERHLCAVWRHEVQQVLSSLIRPPQPLLGGGAVQMQVSLSKFGAG